MIFLKYIGRGSQNVIEASTVIWSHLALSHPAVNYICKEQYKTFGND